MYACRFALLAVGVVLVLGDECWAVERNFVGQSGPVTMGDVTEWDEPDHWDPVGIPVPDDEVTIIGKLVSINRPTAVPGLDISGGGSLHLSQGADFRANLALITLGLQSDGTGTLTLEGGSTMEVTNTDDTGHQFESRIEMGNVLASNAPGFLTVKDGSSITGVLMEMIVGRGRNVPNEPSMAEVNVLTGGVISSDKVILGSRNNAFGLATVSGLGSHWESRGGFVVGEEGEGQVNLLAHGVATAADVTLGNQTTGVGRLSVRTEAGLAAQDIVIGQAGAGALTVAGGGTIYRAGTSRGSLTIAAETGSQGVVTVRDPGSKVNVSYSLYVGGTDSAPGGTASLSIADSGTVDVSQSMKIWGGGTVSLGKTGRLVVSGQTVTVANGAQYYAEPGATIEMKGTNLAIESTNPLNVAGLAQTTFLFAGGDSVTDSIEVAGLDRGQAWSSFGQNIALGSLQIGTNSDPSHVRLSDALANRGGTGSEVLYARHVEIGPGSSLDLNGLTLYTLEYANHGGTLLPGTTGQLIEIGALSRIEADPVAASFEISPDAVDTAFLSLAGQADVHMESAIQQMTSTAATVNLEGLLKEDASANGQADGVFADVTLDVFDAVGDALVRGNIDELILREDSDPANGLVGIGRLTVFEGDLSEGFALGHGRTLAVKLRIPMIDVSDFSANFEGSAKVILMSVPEPPCVCLACMVLVTSVLRWRQVPKSNATAGVV